jgi:recombination protein RecT
MEKHANTYSQAFNLDSYIKLQNGEIPQKDMWKYSSFWYKSFDEMAEKTMIRQLISKWGIMSIEMEDAFTKDMSVIDENGKPHYVDNEKVTVDEEVAADINANANSQDFSTVIDVEPQNEDKSSNHNNKNASVDDDIPDWAK